MRGVRNYNDFIGKRGGYTKGFSTRYGNKKYQVQGDAIFPIESARQYGRSTGGRFWGANPIPPTERRNPRENGRSDSSRKRFGRFSRSINSFHPNQIIGDFVRLPSDYHDYGIHRKPVNFDVKHKRIRPVAAGSTYSYSTLFSPKRISKAREARMLNRGVPTQMAEFFHPQRSIAGCGQQTNFCYSWVSAGMLDNLVAGASQSSGPKTSDLWLRRGNLSLMMTNNTNGNNFVEIWEGYYRRSCADDAVTLWRQGLKDQNMVGPTGLATMPDCLYNMDPLKSRLFCQFCRVTDVTRVELGSGRSHLHKSKYYANVKYNNEIKQEYGTTVTNVGGVTRWIMPIFRGAPVNQQNGNDVSTGQVGMDMIFTVKYNYFYNTPQTTVSFTSGSFPNVTTPIVVNEDTGSGVQNQQW